MTLYIGTMVRHFPFPSRSHGNAPHRATDATARDESAIRTVRPTPLTRRRKLEGMALVPEPFTPGWVQIAGTRTFALGFFLPDGRFTQVALADDRGRVTMTDDPKAPLDRLEPSFVLESEGHWHWDDGKCLGKPHRHGLEVRHGAAYGMVDGERRWLGSWVEHAGTYSVDRMRTPTPDSLRNHVGYRDAVAVAFFGMYLIPSMHGLPLGYGVRSLERRLDAQAPMSAIAANASDVAGLQADGFEVSGLESYAVRLMDEAGALGGIVGLQAEHGAEPMRTIVMPNTGNRYFAWERSLPFDAALSSMVIEGNINRIGQVATWLATNDSYGLEPRESNATESMVAGIDAALLSNPAIGAFAGTLPPFDLDDWQAVNTMVELAEDAARRLAQGSAGEWSVRQALSLLVRTMRLPYRFDVDLRVNLAAGRAALAFTTASPALMPRSEVSGEDRRWHALDDAARTLRSTRYNLRVGIMMAALAFGTDHRIDEVTIRLDSMGLEEAIDQQDQAIHNAMDETLGMLERMQPPLEFKASDKADPTEDELPDALRTAPERDGDPGNLDEEFDRLVNGLELDLPHDMAAGEPHPQEEGDDPLAPLRATPTLTAMATVTFTRKEFLNRLREDGLEHPERTYRLFGACMDFDPDGGLKAIEPPRSIHDEDFAPFGAQQEPEARLEPLAAPLASLLGADDTFGLAIQREGLLANAVRTFHELAADTTLPSVDKAQQAMRLIERIGDPELAAAASQVTTALIDGNDTPELRFTLASDIDDARAKARDLLFGGQVDQAIEGIESVLRDMDERYRSGNGVPRYFNSYADRVVYNRLFALPDETTVLVPDNLVYAHLELADVLSQVKGVDAAIDHLNILVSYAPSYPLVHLKLAAQLARKEDWDSVRAVSLNALRVSLDRADAAWAYHRLGQAAWMRDEFDVSVGCYLMAQALAPQMIPTLREESEEVRIRARSQDIAVPGDLAQAMRTLMAHDIPVWPDTELMPIVDRAAHATVDEGMFVTARTLAVASARMRSDGIDAVQMQFLRSLNP